VTTLFISDLHLSGERQHITDLFIQFLHQRASKADALYILGDLFEIWLGDDLVLPDYQEAVTQLRQLADSGIPLFIMQGNRDFLFKTEFEEQTGATLITDPTVIDLYGKPALLMHGDTLCTDDFEYQKFRKLVRGAQWQTEFLAKSKEERIALSKVFRETSKAEMSGKASEIMDVNQQSVEKAMQEHNVDLLIHGHTHRPDIHHFSVDNKTRERIVLGDWYKQGSVLTCSEHGCRLESFSDQVI
jgi:UDP-2,3-diacylglucosamine hydrolase